MILKVDHIEYYIPIVSGTILFTLLVIFIISFILQYRKAQDRFTAEKDQLKQALLSAEIEIKEQTLVHVSREIHDNFWQVASLIKINLNLLSGDLSQEDRQKVNESLGLIRQLITDMKSLSRSLNGDSLQTIGWLNALEIEGARINRLGSVQLTIQVEGDPEEVGHEEQLMLYRMVQEILNNLLKHAHASIATLTLKCQNGKLEMRYRDDGKGFDLKESKLKEGSGLVNMQERCHQIGAEFVIESTPGHGTRIEIKT